MLLVHGPMRSTDIALTATSLLWNVVQERSHHCSLTSRTCTSFISFKFIQCRYLFSCFLSSDFRTYKQELFLLFWLEMDGWTYSGRTCPRMCFVRLKLPIERTLLQCKVTLDIILLLLQSGPPSCLVNFSPTFQTELVKSGLFQNKSQIGNFSFSYFFKFLFADSVHVFKFCRSINERRKYIDPVSSKRRTV